MLRLAATGSTWLLIGGAVLVAGFGGYALRASQERWAVLRESEQANYDALASRIDRLASVQERTLSACNPPAASAAKPAPLPGTATKAVAVGAPAEDTTALAEAHRVIERALKSGNWLESDVLALRHAIITLDADRQQPIAATLARHLNAGRLKFIGRGAPF